MYTSLEVSKLIQAKCPEVETEHFWCDFRDDIYEEAPIDSVTWNVERNHVGYRYYFYAYTLADVIKAIKITNNKKTISYDTGYIISKLITAYLLSLSLQDPQVEKFLIDLFNN